MKTLKSFKTYELLNELTERYKKGKMSDEIVVIVMSALGLQTGMFMAPEKMRSLLHECNQSPVGYYLAELKEDNTTGVI